MGSLATIHNESGLAAPDENQGAGERRSSSRFDYLLMIVVVYLLAGNPLVGSTPFRVITATLAVLLVLWAVLTGARFTQRQFVVVVMFAGLLTLQAVGTDSFAWFASVGFVARLMIALTAALLIDDFPTTYVDVMFWTAILSFPFFALLILSHGAIVSWLGGFALRVPDPDVLLYYFPSTHLTQNNAYFWEPGVFGGYLVLALVFLGARREHYTKARYRLIFVVLLIAAVTTKSTGGYAALPLAMFYHGRAIGRNLLIRIFAGILAVMFAVVIYQQANFLQGKINQQFLVVEGQTGNWQITRVGTLISDWSQIKVHPVVGWGADASVRATFVPANILTEEGNGLSSFTAEFGAIGLLLFTVATWNGFRSIFKSRWQATLGLIIVLVLLNDECFLSFPLFLSLMFIEGRVRELPQAFAGQSRSGPLGFPAAAAKPGGF